MLEIPELVVGRDTVKQQEPLEDQRRAHPALPVPIPTRAAHAVRAAAVALVMRRALAALAEKAVSAPGVVAVAVRGSHTPPARAVLAATAMRSFWSGDYEQIRYC